MTFPKVKVWSTPQCLLSDLLNPIHASSCDLDGPIRILHQRPSLRRPRIRSTPILQRSIKESKVWLHKKNLQLTCTTNDCRLIISTASIGASLLYQEHRSRSWLKMNSSYMFRALRQTFPLAVTWMTWLGRDHAWRKCGVHDWKGAFRRHACNGAPWVPVNEMKKGNQICQYPTASNSESRTWGKWESQQEGWARLADWRSQH